MIVWDGFKLVGLQIGIVLLILCGIFMLIAWIFQKVNDRKKKRDRERWDKREGVDNDNT